MGGIAILHKNIINSLLKCSLRGKILNKPVSALFGGRVRDRVPVYASTMNYLEGITPEELYPRQAAEKAAEGFKALKMRLGRYSVHREIPIAKAVRKAVGPDIKLMADGNAAYTMKGALDMGQALADLDFDFWEEPLPKHQTTQAMNVYVPS